MARPPRGRFMKKVDPMRSLELERWCKDRASELREQAFKEGFDVGAFFVFCGPSGVPGRFLMCHDLAWLSRYTSVLCLTPYIQAAKRPATQAGPKVCSAIGNNPPPSAACLTMWSHGLDEPRPLAPM
ncbi:hypothetical protein NDU88_004129 [Pleurodeles waltl]|uniref:Uncharacterized protein n=1 Tax=Pleurodeles waltl TaxID=8319 RepID=A0AAV7UEI5_PLEWA|nr:hypothetical protein NDU88_004129 [Pleurodeles waltl]